MAKVAVIYWSGTGNTQVMAEAVVRGAEAAGEGFENVADPRDDRVGGLDEQTDGQEFVDVHG